MNSNSISNSPLGLTVKFKNEIVVNHRRSYIRILENVVEKTAQAGALIQENQKAPEVNGQEMMEKIIGMAHDAHFTIVNRTNDLPPTEQPEVVRSYPVRTTDPNHFPLLMASLSSSEHCLPSSDDEEYCPTRRIKTDPQLKDLVLHSKVAKIGFMVSAAKRLRRVYPAFTFNRFRETLTMFRDGVKHRKISLDDLA
ncbi:unnamed protein product [Caenorhabditis sp. 36 PRJEB53466]|nr:unnamed protein product [Caenorhabditis sp. 36 PRJEB53466]